MAELIKVSCSECGAKYRLPIEFQGRSARCKKCGAKFKIPADKNIEDSVLDWLSEGEGDEQEPETTDNDKPRVVSMADSGVKPATNRPQGVIRMKQADKAAPPDEQ